MSILKVNSILRELRIREQHNKAIKQAKLDMIREIRERLMEVELNESDDKGYFNSDSVFITLNNLRMEVENE